MTDLVWRRGKLEALPEPENLIECLNECGKVKGLYLDMSLL